MSGSSTHGDKTVLHPVTALERAKPLYADAAGQHIGLVPAGGPQGMSSPVWRRVQSSRKDLP
jgi:hypothetical protein